MNRGDAFFTVCEYKVTSEKLGNGSSQVHAIVEVRIDGARCVRKDAKGVGPVHALDNALRKCLLEDFPEIEDVRLSDYRVSVVDAGAATGAKVRVLIEATDGHTRWDAGCVSDNIIDASFEALCAASIMGLMRVRPAAAQRAG
ncbi:MAG TPA: alpha-isopropylmalate synthase regulatory domain-containing protein [Actinomycetota bacterium]|nr:alpha-isopropylmalate synthase regulatory domain-containing protein [Actinomycetota bacterium]